MRIEGVSGFSITVGRSLIESRTEASVNLDGATLESKAGDVMLTARTDSGVRPSANILVANYLSGGAGAEAKANTNATNAINVNGGSVIKGADVSLLAGRNSNAVPNLIDSFANAAMTTFSMYPSIAVPVVEARIDEINTINIDGADALHKSRIEALEDVNLMTIEGLGGDDRARTDGLVLSLSLIPYGFPVPDISPVSSTNTVNVGNDAIVEAGINNRPSSSGAGNPERRVQSADPRKQASAIGDKIDTTRNGMAV